jgi:hypothetical protein
MRSHRFVLFSVVLSLLISLPASSAEETLGQKILSGALSSAGSKGGEFAVKFVSGWIYNISCKPDQQTDEGSKALCSALGGLSGKTEEEWKAKMEAELKKISGQLDLLASGQKQILSAIANQHRDMKNQFKQVPNAVRVTAILTNIDAKWGTFTREFQNPRKEMNPTDLRKFAEDVMKSNLHRDLNDLNSLLTHPIDNAQPVLQFPFYEFRQNHSQAAPAEAFPGREVYEFAEKKFAYYRGEQQKGYLVYLWAAEIIQSQCELAGDVKCDALPMTSTAFAREFERYTREQIEAFNIGANGMILAYSRPDLDSPQFLLRNALTEQILSRVSYLTSTVLGDGEGAWGQVISTAGDPWDGRIVTQCGGSRSVLEPVLSYDVPADTRTGRSVDWWVSRRHNGTYDEVHFSPNWRIHHYKVEPKKLGTCRIEKALPTGSKENLPWVSDQGQIVNVTKNGQTYPVGFFYGLQRAGGTWALASGQEWDIPGAPETADSGDATKKETRFDWVISKNHHEGLWAGLLNMARVDHTFGKSIVNNNQEAKVMNRIYAYNRKEIFFPEGGPVKLHLSQHTFCEKLCRGTDTVEQGILDYDVEHSPYEKGKLTAIVAAFLDPKQGQDNIATRARNGIYLDASYGDTTDHKTHRTASFASGTAQVDPGQAYHLQYYIDFDLVTHSKRVDSTRYRFLGKLTPSLLYVTR